MRNQTNIMLFQSQKPNDQSAGHHQYNQEQFDDYLFLQNESNEENIIFGQRESFPEQDFSSNSFGYNSNDMDSFENYLNINNHLEQEKNETQQDYFAFFKQQGDDNAEHQDMIVEQNIPLQEQQIDYAKFMNDHKDYYVNTQDYANFNELISNYIFNNYQPYIQSNDYVTQIPKINQNSQYNHQSIQFYQITSSEQEEVNKIQVKLEIDPAQMINQKSCLYSSQSNNLEEIKNNYQQKINYQSSCKNEIFSQSSNNQTIQSQLNSHTVSQVDNKLEQTFEQAIQTKILPISRNYYQMYEDYQKKQNKQNQNESKLNIFKIPQNYQEKSNKQNNTVTEQQNEYISNSTLQYTKNYLNEMQTNQQKPDEQQQIQEIDNTFENNKAKKEIFNYSKYNHIQNSNKKNVVKNIMTAFKNFILEPIHYSYNPKDLDTALELYNDTKIHKESLSQMQSKFKRYISPKNFNHYTVKLMIQHQNYSNVFKYFLSGPFEQWLQNSNISDTQSHKLMIDYLRECFDDISLIDYLRRHEKKKAHFQ